MNSDQVSVIYDEQDVPSMIHCTQIEDNITYAPIGRIALYGDIMNLREIKRLLDLHRYEVSILGRRILQQRKKSKWSSTTFLNVKNYRQVRVALECSI